MRKALDFLNVIDSYGYEAYIIGGYPRDLYLGLENPDIDICTNMPPEEIVKHFDIISSFKDLGSFKINYNDSIIELTTFRIEGIYKDLRRPQTVTFVSTLEQDIKRRDFIINTLCIDKDGNYIDLLGARSDIDKKIIRCVGSTDSKLREDPLRIIRCIRFSVDLGFDIDNDIKEFIKENKDLLDEIPTKKREKEYQKCKNKQAFDKLLYNLTK